MKTSVSITVDTEASIARSINRYAEGFRPLLDPFVACTIKGRSEGLGFLIQTLRRYALSATFFVEAGQAQYFGSEPMGRYVEQLLDAGQDVQLHVHPVWFNFQHGVPPADPAERLQDDCGTYTEDALTDLFGRCIDTFRGWTGQAPGALRTGGFSCSRAVFRVLSNCAIPCSSSICVGISEPLEPEYRRPSGWLRAEGVCELPATCFLDRHPGRAARFRPLQITACSAAELIGMLDQAHALGMTEVVLLTHPFEFVRASTREGYRPGSYDRMRVNRTTQRRFERVCAYLAKHTDRFAVTTFGQWARQATDPGLDLTTQAHPELRGSPRLALARSLANAVSDRLPW
jgi:hypothetical protein